MSLQAATGCLTGIPIRLPQFQTHCSLLSAVRGLSIATAMQN